MSFRLFSSILTAGNKSKCGTLQRLTHPRQSTVEAIFRPVSPPKRQAMQGKSFVLSPISTQTSSRLRIHGTSVPSTLHTRAPTYPSHPKVACNSRTRVTQQHELIRTCNTLKGNCMRNCGTPCRPLSKSHVIPPGPDSSIAQKQRNINDPISNSETSSRELRAKLLSFTRFLGSPARRPPRGLRGNRGVAAAPGTPAAPQAPPGGRRVAWGPWPGFETTLPATRQRHSAAGVEGAGGTGGHGRASRSTTPSRRPACGDLAGGRARRRPEHQRRNKHR